MMRQRESEERDNDFFRSDDSIGNRKGKLARERGKEVQFMTEKACRPDARFDVSGLTRRRCTNARYMTVGTGQEEEGL